MKKTDESVLTIEELTDLITSTYENDLPETKEIVHFEIHTPEAMELVKQGWPNLQFNGNRTSADIDVFEQISTALQNEGFLHNYDYDFVTGEDGVEEDSSVGELSNGYNDYERVHNDEMFPTGQTSNAQKKLGPSAAKHGNNPMYANQYTESLEETYKEMVKRYKSFLKNSK